jgi:hypothetical protein
MCTNLPQLGVNLATIRSSSLYTANIAQLQNLASYELTVLKGHSLIPLEYCPVQNSTFAKNMAANCKQIMLIKIGGVSYARAK